MAKPVISLSLAKQHLRVEHDYEDAIIVVMAAAAVDSCLAHIGLAGEMEERTDQFRCREFRFPFPLQAVTSVSRYAGGEWLDLADDQYSTSGNVDRGYRLILSDAVEAGVYQVAWEAGFATLPPTLEMAALFLLGHYFENRGAVAVGQGIATLELPFSVRNLLDPWRHILFA